MIKVGYVLTPVYFGGSEKVNLTFLRNVDRTRFDIYPILLIRPWEAENVFVKELEKANYHIYKIPVAAKPRSEGRDYFRIPRCIRNIRNIAKREAFHLIHTHGYLADIIGIPLSNLMGIPNISTCHGFISNDSKLVAYNWLDRFFLRFAKKIIAVSEGIQNDLIRSGIDGSRIIVVQNAVQNCCNDNDIAVNRLRKREDLGIKDNECLVGYVGRLSEEKGVHYLINAGSILKRSDELCKVLIVGDGPRSRELENLAKENGLEKTIVFVGFQDDVEKWIPAMDIFVLPSLTEGTPMALLEAMSFGVPVIATRVGGVPRVIEDGVNGILINPGDSRALCEKIITLKQNQMLRKKMAIEALNVIKNRFSANEWCRKIEAQYERLVQV